jgi:hypothetical protein
LNITAIEVTHVKGIANQKFNWRLMPNKPNLLVAPNGVGKSSLAVAFGSMNSQRMVLGKNDYYQCDDSNAPELILTVENGSQNAIELRADNSSNEIRASFDVTVINSRLTPKGKRGYMGGVSANLEIAPIDICKIPEKTSFSYQCTGQREIFGTNGKVVPNLTSLLKNTSILKALNACDFKKTQGQRVQGSITEIVAQINQENGSTESIRQWIARNQLVQLKKISHLNTLALKLEEVEDVNSEVEAFLAAIQIVALYSQDSNSFDRAVSWLQYTSIKGFYEELLEGFCSSDWQWAELREDNTTEKLSVNFPQAHQISNGQRDILTLVIQMHKALYDNRKKPLILIIDEVFDYLDDANLVAFQYYVTNLIEKYKEREQILYPLILTHLDPGVFFDFCFNKHKIHIHYLCPYESGKVGGTLKLLELREKVGHQDLLEMYWFHYHPEQYTIETNSWHRDIPDAWKNSSKFYEYIDNELVNYLQSSAYDPVAVCFAIRISIERQVHDLLDNEDKTEFIKTNTTRSKLDFASSKQVDVSETFFLLGLIYNTNLHWKQGRDYETPLITKLNHPTIRALVQNVVQYDASE